MMTADRPDQEQEQGQQQETIAPDQVTEQPILTLSEPEQQGLAILRERGYELETYENKRGQPRGIIRAVKTTVDKLHPNPWNPNSMTVRQGEATQESLDEFGQILELVVRPHPENPSEFQIVDGEHRFERLNQRVSVNILFGLTEAEAKKLTIVLNNTRGEADKIELAKLLAEIQDDLGEQTITALPYTDIELEELIKLASVDWDNYGLGGEDDDQDGLGDDDSDEDDEWVTLRMRIPKAAMERIQDAYNLIEQERKKLHQDKEIAWGTVLESLAADYLATPRSSD